MTYLPQCNRWRGTGKAPWLVLLVVWLWAGTGAAWAGMDPVFKPLLGELKEQGFKGRQVQTWLSHPGLRFEAKVLARMLSTRESKLNYGQFLSRASLARAREFGQRHKKTLRQAQEESQVPGAVIVAILAVESNLGSYQGRHSVFNMLASQAVLDTALARRRLTHYWPNGRKKELAGSKLRARLKRRAQWARGELGELLRWAKGDVGRALALKGSAAGALGMCQFVPSSLVRHGRDGDQDGRVDLARPADAIHSVGVYLSRHGWRPGISYREQVRVIKTYNRSQPYARTVLELARRLQ